MGPPVAMNMTVQETIQWNAPQSSRHRAFERPALENSSVAFEESPVGTPPGVVAEVLSGTGRHSR